jgi:pyruvate-formate lyase-activating enzyme
MFCTQPFNHIDIIVENQKVMLQPCNVWKSKQLDIEEYKNTLSELKDILANSYHDPGCSICQNEDKKNIRSRRVAQNQFTDDNNLSLQRIQSLGVRYSTLCNSKCMICDHTRSSSWVPDSEKLGLIVDEQYRYKKNLLPGVGIFFDNFDLSDLRYVEFHGGEPLMQSYPTEFLKRIKNLDQLIVKFNTNLTLLPSPELNDLLKKCKRVDFLLSVDDIGDRYEMLRYPGKWNVFTKNIDTLKKEGYKTTAYNCISSLNIFYILEFYKWAIQVFLKDVHSQFVVNQEMLDISHLPQHAKNIIYKKIENNKGKLFDSIREKLNIQKENRSKELLQYIANLDAIRNTNYTETFKEWHTILKNKK